MPYYLKGNTAEELYAEACWSFALYSTVEDTRNGMALTVNGPSIIEMSNPKFRIVTNPDRNANPFFHCMEFIWMMAGRNDLEWIEQFNRGIARYAEPATSYREEARPYTEAYFHGAYGYRWRHHFGFDQLARAVYLLAKNPEDRRITIAMWDPAVDMAALKKDIPCNTQIMFRAHEGALDMTVINRSNDLVWGALGANIVHMTMLHELIASGANLKLGTYRVASTNLHVYEKHWGLLGKKVAAQSWLEKVAMFAPQPLMQPDGPRDIGSFLRDAETFCNEGELGTFKHTWFRDVAVPMKLAYLDKEPGRRNFHINNINCPAWQQGVRLWEIERQKR